MSSPDDDKTRMVRRSSGSSPMGSFPPPPKLDDESTVYVPGTQADVAHSQDGTRIVQRGAGMMPPPPSPPVPPPPQAPDGHTVLVRPGSRSPKSTAVPSGTGTSFEDFPAEGPLVGWLVVMKGPGRGRSVTLGYGNNSIGRDLDNRVALPFNDEQISRKKHAVITYDPRGKKFYIQHGDSTNLSYVGDSPVLSPMMLQGGETIRLGDCTELKFVPFCGAEFDWESS